MTSVQPLAALENAGRAPSLPIDVILPGAPTKKLRLEHLLRVLPGRRYVGVGYWNEQGQERKVFAKLLVGGTAQRQFEREKTGALLLAAQGLDTPRLLADASSQGEGAWLLFEYLERGQSLGARWREIEKAPFSIDAQEQLALILKEALPAIAQLHAQGLWQEDLHLDNLFDQGGRLYLVDGGGIHAENPGAPLSRQKTLDNLGIFFAQFPSRLDASLKVWLDIYMRTNPSHPLHAERPALQKAIDRERHIRLRDLLKKIGRDCSLFSVRKNGPFGAFGFCVMRRDEADALKPLVEDPDAFIARGHIYKTGGAATVARVESAGRSFIVKRYNIKHFRHWLGRFWRPSRAWTAWREGNRLLTLGIATAKPLAVIERRWMGLRGPAFLITEYLEGQDIMTHFQADFASGIKTTADSFPEAELTALQELFAALRRERIGHGDFKGHNLIWQAGKMQKSAGCCAVIDLDATRAYRSEVAFARAHARDRERFLRNWPEGNPLFRLLSEIIPATADKQD
jgi:tRNA A-37 threonylcarbamoyl transferase component Bud32